jgi:N-acetylneuraminic acid mutarotase
VPAPRLEPGVAAVGQRLVVVGGFDTGVMQGNHITARVDMFDTIAGTWSQLPDAPVAWTHIQVAGVGTTFYLLGGSAGPNYTAQGQAWRIDLSAANPVWQAISPLPSGLERGSAAVFAAPDRIYLLGGASTTNALASTLYYSIADDTWHTLPDLPAPRSHPAGMVRGDGTLVVTGGLGGLYATDFAADTWQLPPGGSQWQIKTAMPDARGGCAYGVIQGSLVCAGGEADTSALRYVESYDPLADHWTEGTFMPMPTAGAQGAVIADRLYVPGGARQLVLEPTDTLYVYAPVDTGMP